MKIPIYHIDAFASEIFSGNPAAVCLLDSWIDDKLLQSIAAENNLSETAFLVPNELYALQVSKRGGELFCTNAGNRVKISGKAVLYMEGIITV